MMKKANKSGTGYIFVYSSFYKETVFIYFLNMLACISVATNDLDT